MPSTLKWNATLRATSSIAHGGETRGTITLLRREMILGPTGTPLQVPIVSGNGLRGRLRRIGEELLRDVLQYEQQLPLSAAHALRGGGSLAKTTGEPLSGRRLQTLRELIPQVGVFGCAAGGRIIDGCLQVGKVVPHLAETAHILDPAPQSALPAFDATQIETYIRQDDTSAHAFAELTAVDRIPVIDGVPQLDELPEPSDTDQLMRFRIETLPAGTTMSTWLRLDRATPREVAFFTEVLEVFTRDGRIGGRAAIGHGQVATELTCTQLAGEPAEPVDWRAPLLADPAAAITALQALA